eukprot:4891542-Pleurochrysis_carterae.AAC.1
MVLGPSILGNDPFRAVLYKGNAHASILRRHMAGGGFERPEEDSNPFLLIAKTSFNSMTSSLHSLCHEL